MQEPLQLITFSDASYANLPDGGSQGAHIIFLKGNNNMLAPIEWSSKKVRRICRSTISAETMSLLDAVDNSIWLSSILKQISIEKPVISIAKTDNEGLSNAVYSTTPVTEKRLRVDIAGIKEEIKNRNIKVEWIPKQKQLADSLTKQGANTELLLKTLHSMKEQ